MSNKLILINGGNERFLGDEIASIYASAYCRGFEFLQMECLSVHFDEWWDSKLIINLIN